MSPRKSHPKGIDMAAPNRNFVEMSFKNKGDEDGYMEYMYGGRSPWDDPTKVPQGPKSSGYGHGVERRKGYLRMSGTKGAHRIGKR